MSRLPKSQVCPIHRSRFCCGREPKESRRRTPIRGPVTRIPDAHHPRGYIEVCSPAEIRRRLIIKMRQQVCICGICGLPIFEFSDAVADHIEPNPAGCKKDSHIGQPASRPQVVQFGKGFPEKLHERGHSMKRLYGQEFLEAELRIMRQIPKKYRGRVRELVNRMQFWDINVFMNIAREQVPPKMEVRKETL